jgi:hypothetical protein
MAIGLAPHEVNYYLSDVLDCVETEPKYKKDFIKYIIQGFATRSEACTRALQAQIAKAVPASVLKKERVEPEKWTKAGEYLKKVTEETGNSQNVYGVHMDPKKAIPEHVISEVIILVRLDSFMSFLDKTL